MEQKIEIKVPDIGIFIISKKTDNTYSTDNITINNLKLTNIPVVQKTDNLTPIQYSRNKPNIFLLEETEYEIYFKSDENLDNYSIFHTLKQSDDTLKINKLPNSTEYLGFLNFKSFAGKTFLDIQKEGKIIYQLPIEVRSKKIDYNEQYPAMIGDLSEYSSGLLFEINSTVYQHSDLIETKNDTLYEDFMLLEYLFKEENLPSTFEYLSRNLYTSLENIKEEVPTSLASNIGPNELIDIVSNPENLYKTDNNKFRWNKGFIPQKINQTTYIDNIDTPENRFYKNFLELIEDLIVKLLKEAGSGYVKDKLLDYYEEINYFLSQRYFKDISKMNYAPLNSQVLQKKEGYRDILQYFLMFEFGFKMNWNQVTDEFKGFEKKLHELYEYWCYFELIHVMKELTNSKINFEDVFKINKNNWTITLKEGQIKEFDLNVDEKPIKIELMYNKTFDRRSNEYQSYSVQMRPDYTIAIKLEDKEYKIHFDAKYKVDLTNETYQNPDIVKMHAYKDAIKNTIGSYILYPGATKELFTKNQFESVGAFTLNPGKNMKERKEIVSFIRDLIMRIILNKDTL